MTEYPQHFGKYQILAELGAGGFATVYKAVDTTLDREVALKILHPPLLTDRRFVQNFRQEAKTLAALRHPQIITVYEVGEADGRLFIAMDLARGVSLAKAITSRQRITWNATLALLKPVCEAIDYAHEQSVVHRDLKPANILIDKQRGALLTDFGFARLMAENTMSMSISGGIVGTPSYIAPEVWEDNAASPPVDIYALGCIVYEMLTSNVLFKGQTQMQAMRAHDRGPQFPEIWPKEVPAGLTDVLGKALARDPAARHPSASALWHALNELEAQEQAAREAVQSTALAAQWRAEAERALAAKEWNAARMAIERWQIVTPNDPEARNARARLERISVRSQVELAVSPPPQATPLVLQKKATNLHQRFTPASEIFRNITLWSKAGALNLFWGWLLQLPTLGYGLVQRIRTRADVYMHLLRWTSRIWTGMLFVIVLFAALLLGLRLLLPFFAATPALLAATPSDGDAAVTPRTRLTLRFDGPMNPRSVERAVMLRPAAAWLPIWSDDRATLTISPTETLHPDTNYTLTLDTQALSWRFRALDRPIELHFRTAPAPTVVRELPTDGTIDVLSERLISIKFSRTVQPITLLMRSVTSIAGSQQFLRSKNQGYSKLIS